MNLRLPNWMMALLVVLAAAGGLGWLVYQARSSPTLTTTPPVTSTTSPLSSPVVNSLRQRTVYGNITLTDQSPYDRLDPFARP